MVRDDDRGVECDSFVRDGFCEVDGKEDYVGWAARGDEGGFEEEAGVVPRAVC